MAARISPGPKRPQTGTRLESTTPSATRKCGHLTAPRKRRGPGSRGVFGEPSALLIRRPLRGRTTQSGALAFKAHWLRRVAVNSPLLACHIGQALANS